MNISVEREASFEVSHQNIKKKDEEDAVYEISGGNLIKTIKGKLVNLSVESEASFEVSQKNVVEDNNNTLSDSPTANRADVSAPKPNDAKTSDGNNSPTKVMDFVDEFSSAQFFTPTINIKDSHNLSGCFDESKKELRESVPSDFSPFDPPSANDDDDNEEAPNKVLFPDDQESKEIKISIEEDESNQINDSLDVNGFPIPSSACEIHSAGSVAFDDGYSAGSVAFDFMKGDANVKEEKSLWRRWIDRIPEGTRVKAMQVRRQIMACHQSSPVVLFDDSIDQSTIGGNNSSIIDESMFSYKSLQQLSASMLSTSQDIISVQSNVSTPVRKQSKGKSDENYSSESVFPKFSVGNNDKPSNSTLKLCIDLYHQSAFKTLMSNLERSSQVQEVHVFRSWEEGNEERTRTVEDIQLLLKTIGSLPNLKILNLANFLIEDVNLVSLSQWKNENLNTIRIHLCKGALSKHLLAVLARLPALKDLTLEMNLSFPFHILFRSKTLESLTIVANNFQIDNLHAMEMVQEIPRNYTLKKLTIEPDLRLRTFTLLASALCRNMSIEEICFSLLPESAADNDRCMNELARTLKTNGSLRSIRNLNYKKIEVEDDRTCDALMKALSENYIIEDFLVFNEEPWFRDRKNRILKENKMEYDSLFPQMLKCVGNDQVVDEVSRTNISISVANSTSTSVRNGLSSIGDSIKSRAKRVASGALDFVGQTVGLK